MNSSNIKKLSEVVTKHSPEIITAVGVMASVIGSMTLTKRKAYHCEVMYKITGEEKYHVEYLRMTKSNNWLRMHGYPMRRNNHR